MAEGAARFATVKNYPDLCAPNLGAKDDVGSLVNAVYG